MEHCSQDDLGSSNPNTQKICGVFDQCATPAINSAWEIYWVFEESPRISETTNDNAHQLLCLKSKFKHREKYRVSAHSLSKRFSVFFDR